MQYWPRKRARKVYARVRSWAASKEAKPLGFAGYKVGMSHVMFTDNKKESITRGEEISVPVTIIECPPIKVASIRFYKNTIKGLKLISEVFSDKLDKELERRITLPKKIKNNVEDIKDFDDIRIFVYTQPGLTAIGKKKPELFEVALGGSKEEKLNYSKEKLGKEITAKEVFREGQQLDIHAVTKGRGFQGPMKRFGISRRRHKSEKSIRNPGSLGAWKAQGQTMWRVAHAGKMGFHTRTEYNKWLLKIGEKPEELRMDGGIPHYGAIKNHYLLIKGGIAGPAKRLVRITDAVRASDKTPKSAPEIQYVSLASKQGN